MRKSIVQLGLRTEPASGKYPEGSYLIRRYSYRLRTRLLELVLVKKNTFNHIGTIDLLDIVFIANKKRLKDLSKEDFYGVLQNIFSVEFDNNLYVTPETEIVINQLFSHFVKQPYIARKSNRKEIF